MEREVNELSVEDEAGEEEEEEASRSDTYSPASDDAGGAIDTA